MDEMQVVDAMQAAEAQPVDVMQAVQEPAFYKWQLKESGLLNVHVDVFDALFQDDVQYTISQAQAIINEFMSKEV